MSALTPEHISKTLLLALNVATAPTAAHLRRLVMRVCDLQQEALTEPQLAAVNSVLPNTQLTAQEGMCLLNGMTWQGPIRSDFIEAVTRYWRDEGVVSLITSRLSGAVHGPAALDHMSVVQECVEDAATALDKWKGLRFHFDFDLCSEGIYTLASLVDVRVDLDSEEWLEFDPHQHASFTIRTMGVLCYAWDAIRGEI